jgi:hypothetical protein
MIEGNKSAQATNLLTEGVNFKLSFAHMLQLAVQVRCYITKRTSRFENT